MIPRWIPAHRLRMDDVILLNGRRIQITHARLMVGSEFFTRITGFRRKDRLPVKVIAGSVRKVLVFRRTPATCPRRDLPALVASEST